MIEALLGGEESAVALVDAETGDALTYGALRREVASRVATLGKSRPLVFLAGTNSVESVLLYLAALAARAPVALVPPDPAAVARLVAAYQPSIVLLPDAVHAPSGYVRGPSRHGHAAWTTDAAPRHRVHDDLALLLTTSGSTGSPKLVRLGERQILANARSIAEYLGLGPRERAVLSLPLVYSYGLSIVNSHLVAGGTVVVIGHSFLRPEFWAAFDAQRCTSFAGVPYAYETLKRLRFDPAKRPTLRTLTQAGGRLATEHLLHFDALARAAGARFFAMYGQTEATARIAYVPHEDLALRAGSIGRAIPGGALRLDGGELVYEGPNVMFGYAETPDDLARGDDLRGVLRTGDLAEDDGRGSFRIVGRTKRFAKLAGSRVSLDDVEREVETAFGLRAAAVEAAPGLRVVVESPDATSGGAVRARLAERLAVAPPMIEVRVVAELPVTASGKKDYRSVSA